uniref:Zinc finger protein 816-like n=1 Tax=Saccoglossus kowalevskii TaxID=10224 RepID=A0ABM0LW51_SACKO|nr:PREDICTED: zinc finger protein 816-like [Saccoglossus kowalevskii]
MSDDDNHTRKRRQVSSSCHLECSFCCKVCPDKLYLRQHQWMHEGLKPLKCNMCPKSFCWYSTLTAHKRTHRKKRTSSEGSPSSPLSSLPTMVSSSSIKNPYSVDQPLSELSPPSSLESTADSRRISCKQCSRSFSTPSGLKYHMLSHNSVKRFICQICSRQLSSRQGLDYHLRCHSGERPYKCEECPKTFRNQTLLNTHYSHRHPHIKDVPVYSPDSPSIPVLVGSPIQEPADFRRRGSTSLVTDMYVDEADVNTSIIHNQTPIFSASLTIPKVTSPTASVMSSCDASSLSSGLLKLQKLNPLSLIIPSPHITQCGSLSETRESEFRVVSTSTIFSIVLIPSHIPFAICHSTNVYVQ